jgi:hypothetical protein
MPRAYAVGWPKFATCGLEDVKMGPLKIAHGLPIVISDQMQSGY